ncbi:hypothetical protein [Aliiroseovarius crassostreae]|uniref:hypothetical protein n=1 Tax=Aliiroseovarius crassostreae TaxID=154981 RepID=UPI0021FB3135|nr:hypothetical protein [Aliiroseovarius crassostreae]UWP97786.1 hypothetical protein K3X53_10400 [Aliiroseovarius crassostreae]
MRLKLGNVMRLLLALTILASVFIRPPGTMLVTEGDTISYVLCSAGEPQTVHVALGGEEREERDLSCDFFAAQIASLIDQAPAVVPFDYTNAPAEHVAQSLLPTALRLWRPNAARAPPSSADLTIQT